MSWWIMYQFVAVLNKYVTEYYNPPRRVDYVLVNNISICSSVKQLYNLGK